MNMIALITMYASLYGVDPNLALSIAKVESGYNPNAVSYKGAVGLFQIIPRYTKYSKEQLLDPVTNTKEAMRIIREYQKNCVHKEKFTWLVCYNFGINNAKKVKHPHLFPYVKKVKKEYERRTASNW